MATFEGSSRLQSWIVTAADDEEEKRKIRSREIEQECVSLRIYLYMCVCVWIDSVYSKTQG